MSNLVVSFGRIVGPVMLGRDCRTELIAITTVTSGTMVCDPGDHHQENVADLLAEAACWVCIGASPTAAVNGSNGSFKMLEGERHQRALVKGDKVSVIAA